MAVPYRPPSRLRRAGVWLAGFVVTGRVFHAVSERDLRRLSPAEVAFHAGCMCVVLAAVAYARFVIPEVVRSTVFAVGLGVVLLLAGLPFAVQWAVTKGLEFLQ